MQVEVDGEDVALYHTSDNQWYATSDVCTHGEQSLASGSLNGRIVACPKHGGKFDITTGNAVALPCVVPVETYPVQVRGNEVYVDFD